MTPDDPDLARAFETTWPAAETRDSGALRTGRALGAGGRVGSTRALGADWTEGDIAGAEAVHRAWGQPPLFRVARGDGALRNALAARGYLSHTPTAIMARDCAGLAGRVPGMTAFAIWPPLAIQADLWAAGAIGAARQAVMARVALPRAALLGRLHARAAGAAFVAADGPVAMIHAIEVAPAFRRQGLAGWLIGAAADWALASGADRLALAVGRDNAPARTAYDKAGFAEVGAYDYWSAGD